MRPDDPNLSNLRVIAAALDGLEERVVFVGGAVAGLLVSDPLAEQVRATVDVDAVVEARIGQFQRIERQVAARGFERDMDSAVICRWIHRKSGIPFDLMPVESDVLGFSNRWYRYALDSAVELDVGEGLRLWMAGPAAFVATKLEAYAGRGMGDFLASHDLEDVLNIVDGREALAEEVMAAPEPVRAFICESFAGLLAQRDFNDALPGLIADPARADIVAARLNAIVESSDEPQP